MADLTTLSIVAICHNNLLQCLLALTTCNIPANNLLQTNWYVNTFQYWHVDNYSTVVSVQCTVVVTMLLQTYCTATCGILAGQIGEIV